jgi:cell division septation protein DedD
VETSALPTSSDQVPNRQELTEQSKGAQQAADESLNQALHDEVARTGIKLDSPKQVQLPEKTKSAESTAAAPTKHSEKVESAAFTREAPQGKFTLQIGSFPTLEEARDQADSLEAMALKPFMRPAEVKGKRWYRVYVGGFNTLDAAEKTGAGYLSQRMIEGFIVTKMVDR